MSDLFETFVFDLQRFATGTYGSIEDLAAGQSAVAGKTYWSKDPGGNRPLYLYTDAAGTSFAKNATITYSTSSTTTGSTTYNYVTAVTEVKPHPDTEQLLFNGAAGASGATTLQFKNGSGEFYFGLGGEEGDEETDASAPTSAHFMGNGDALVMTEATAQTFTGEKLYIGSGSTTFENVLPAFDLTEAEGTTLALTSDTAKAQFEISGLSVGDIIHFTDDIFINTGGTEKAGKVTFTAVQGQSSPNLDFEVSDGGAVGVEAQEDIGIKDDKFNVNEVDMTLGTTDFNYKKSGSEGLLELDDIDFGPDSTADNLETTSRTFIIGSTSLNVYGMSDEGSAFIVDETAKNAKGFVFSSADQQMTVIVPAGAALPDGFKFYSMSAAGSSDNPTSDLPADMADDNGYNALNLPTVTGGTYAITKNGDVYSLIVGGNATVTDSDGTQLTFDGVGNGFVQIVFDPETGNLKGVMPSDKGISAGGDSIIAIDPAFTSGMEINVLNEFSGLSIASSSSVYDSNLISIAGGSYIYKYVGGNSIGITLGKDTDTVYALDSATALFPVEGKGKVTDATDGDDDSSNDPTYSYVTANGSSAYFKVDNAAASSHKITGFAFDTAGDKLTIDQNVGASFGLYYNKDNVETQIPGGIVIGEGDDLSFAIEMTGAQSGTTPAEFAVKEFSEAGVGLSFGGGSFVFGTQTDEFYFNGEGKALGFNAGGSVAMDAGAAAFLAGGSFAINGASVDISGDLEGDALIFNAGDSSLFGLSSGAEIKEAGVITKVYGASGTDNTLTVGGTSYIYSAQGTTADERAYFTVDGDSATGFTFVEEDDALKVTADMVSADFSLEDETLGSISTPEVFGSDGNAKAEYMLTKKSDPDYAISGFSTGDYAQVGEGTVTFENLGGDSASIIFDATSAEIGGISYLTKGDEIKVDGISSAINFDGDAVQIESASSYTYSKTGESTAAITDLYPYAVITQLGSASKVVTAAGESGIGQFTFVEGGQNFEVYAAEDESDEISGVTFEIGSAKNVTAISGLSSNEAVYGSAEDFADVAAVNGQSFGVAGASEIELVGNDANTGLTEINVSIGSAVQISNTAGASSVTATDVERITFGSDSTFQIVGLSDSTDIEFYLDGLAVKGVSDVNDYEIVRGNFAGVSSVNGQSFAVQDKDDIAVLGNADATRLVVIASVGDSAVINNVAGASFVITNEEGSFTFAGNSAPFTVAGDSSVDFIMNPDEAAQVAGVSYFGDAGTSATLAGMLQGIDINNSGAAIDIVGDSDKKFAYMVDASGSNATLGQVGGDSVVTITETAGALFVQTSASGTFVFAKSGQSFETDDDSLTFELDDSGKVIAIHDLDDGKQVSGSFSTSIEIFGSDNENATIQVLGDDSITAYNDAIIITDLSNGATIAVADDVTLARTDALELGSNSIAIEDADEHRYTVTGGIDVDGVDFLLKDGHIVGVSSLGEGITLSGALSALEQINGASFDVVDPDGEFAVVGAESGIGSITDVGNGTSVNAAGGASKVVFNDPLGIIEFTASGQSFALIESDRNVEFVMDGDTVAAINDLNNIAIFNKADQLDSVNGKDFEIYGDDDPIVVIGNDSASGIAAIAAVGSDSATVTVVKTGGASYIITDKEGAFYFVDGAQSFATSDDNTVAFGMKGDSSIVETIEGLSGVVVGKFDQVAAVNGKSFDITDADGKLSVKGTSGESAIAAIGLVTGDAEINDVGGASMVQTDSDGVFDFAGHSSTPFIVAGDSSVDFMMVSGQSAQVEGINNFAVNGESEAFVFGELNGLYINGKDNLIKVEGDDILAYGVETFEGEQLTALAVGGSAVTVNAAASATFIEVVQDGKYTFAMGSASSATYKVATAGDSAVLFEVEGNKATAILDMDKNTSVTGDFSNEVYLEGIPTGASSEADYDIAAVQIAGDSKVMVVYDGFEVRMLSDNASISVADNIYDAYTDPAANATLAVFDASGDKFVVAGDSDGVHYLLNGEGEIIGVTGLDKGATLGGNLGELTSINGKSFAIVESQYDSLNAGDGAYSVVGADDGISEVVGLSGLVFVADAAGASVLKADGNIALFNVAGGVSQLFVGVAGEPKSTVFTASDGFDFYLDKDTIHAIDDIDGDEVVLGVGFSSVEKLNNAAFDIQGDSGALAVLGNDKLDRITAVIGVGNSVDGATVAAAAGASFILTDSTGTVTFGTGSAADTFTLTSANNSSVGIGFNVDANVAVGSISYVSKADKVLGKFTDGRIVNGDYIQATDSADGVIGVAGSDSYAGVTELFVRADATVTAWGSATSVNAQGAGDYVFIGADGATQTFTAADTSEDNELTFITDADRVTGVEELSDGYIRFDPNETGSASLNVNIAHYPGQTMTFASTEKVSLTVDPYEVVVVEGVTGSVSGVVGKDTPATVIGPDGVTSLTVNGKTITVDDDDDQFNVVVHDTTPDYVYAVDGDATVDATDVSVRANSTGSAHASENEFVIGGESYYMDDSKDENDGFTFVTDSLGAMNKVVSLEGGLVINDGEWDGNINGDDFSVADPGTNELPVTVNSGVSGIESVGGLEDGDSVAGDLGAAQVHIPGYGEDGSGAPDTTVWINGKPFTLYNDADGVDVTGDDSDVISDLDKDAQMTGPDYPVTVNGTALEPEEGDIIEGVNSDKTQARIIGDDRLIRYSTPVNYWNSTYNIVLGASVRDTFNIEEISGMPYYTGAATMGVWDKETSDYAQAYAGTSLAIADFDQPMVVYLDNEDDKETQVFDMSGYSYTKKVYLWDGAQAVKFNNEGGNLARVGYDGSTGVKSVSLGSGGDAVVVDEGYALQNAVNIYGGAGKDSVYVRNNVNTYIDLSAGGADMILTFGEANARITLDGYQASTGAAIRVEEYLDADNTSAGSIAEGIENGTIGFAEGTVYITSPEGKSEIYVGTNGYGGQIVNLMTHATSGNDVAQAVGFTGADGGLVDGSTFDSPLIMYGNWDNTKSDTSSLIGGSANDTFYAGGNDIIEVGYGNDLVKLYDGATRSGALIDIGYGRTTIEGMQNTLADSSGDIISVDITPTDGTFSLVYDDETQTVELSSSADGYYALLTDVDVYEGNYTTQYIYDETGDELYSVAIGTVNSTIQVTEDEDYRPNVFFGYQTAIDFRNYTGDAIIDLRGDVHESLIDETIVIIDDDITTLYAGIGDTALKGDLDDETLYAGKGNTWLYGDGGKNLLVGYTDADKEGQTVFYVLGNEDGAAHTISGFNYVTDDNYTDTKKVTADALEFDMDDNQITRIDISGSDIVFEITDKAGNDTESALLLDAINSDGTGKDFIVSDVVAQVAEDTLVFDQYADYYYATGKNATVQVSGRIEDDVVLWLDEDDTGKYFEGDIAVIDATGSDATAQLAGNDNDNVIYAGTGETSLWGGEGGNDVLVGNSGGRDTFYYSFGNGDDTITNVKDGDLVALDVSLDQIDEIDMSDATAIRIIMNDQSTLTINDNGASVGIIIDNGEGGTDTYYTDEARARQ